MEYNELVRAIELIDNFVKAMKTHGHTPIEINKAQNSLKALKKVSLDFAIKGEIIEIYALNGKKGTYWALVDGNQTQRNY